MDRRAGGNNEMGQSRTTQKEGEGQRAFSKRQLFPCRCQVAKQAKGKSGRRTVRTSGTGFHYSNKENYWERERENKTMGARKRDMLQTPYPTAVQIGNAFLCKLRPLRDQTETMRFSGPLSVLADERGREGEILVWFIQKTLCLHSNDANFNASFQHFS